MNDHTEIGYVRKTHGYKGVVKIVLLDHIDLEDGIPAFFLEKNGERLPYFPESIGFNGSGEMLLKLEEVNSSEVAALLKGSTVYVDTKFVILSDDNEGYLDLAGFTLIDLNKGNIGPVIETLELPGHDVLVVKYDGREIMVPFHEELVESIEEEQQVIRFRLPEGILEL